MANAQSLVLRFNADTAPAKRAFTEMAQTGAAQMALLAGAAAASGRKIDTSLVGSLARLAASITGLQLAYAGFAAVSASSLAIAIDKLGEYRKVLQEANQIGVSTDFFQRFTQAAGQAGDKVKQLQEGLRNARAATREGLETSAVGGRLNTLFESGALGAAGEAARQAFQAASTTEQKVAATIAVIDDLRARGNDLLALDLAEKLFGQQAADALIERANRAGASLSEMVNTTADKKVVSPDQIENARLLEERLEAARRTMAEGMRPILEDLERLGTALYSGWVSTETAIAAAVVTVGKLYTAVRNVVTLLPAATDNVAGAVAATAEAQVASLNSQIASLQRSGVFDPRLKGLVEQRDRAQGQANAARGQQQLRDNAVPVVDLPTTRPQVAPGDPALQAFRDTQRARQGLALNPPSSSPRSGGGGAGGGDSDLEFYQRYVAGIEKATAALKTEIETLGLSTFERERATLSSKAYAEFKAKDIELSDSQRAKIDELVEAQARLKAQLEATKEAQAGQRELLQFAGSSISSFYSDIVSGGKNAEQSIMNITKRLADAAFQALLLGQGPLAKLLGTAGSNGDVGGLLGGLFGSKGLLGGFFGGGAAAGSSAFGFATGGLASFDVGSSYVPRDMFARVHRGEKILTAADAKRDSRPAQPVMLNQTFDLRGADTSPQMVALIRQQAAQEAVRAIEAKRATRPNYLQSGQ